MDEISIKDSKSIINDADQLTISNVNLESCKDTIQDIINQVKDFWEQTQQDAQKFSKGLENNVAAITNIVECNKEFANAIINYASLQEQTASNVIE